MAKLVHGLGFGVQGHAGQTSQFTSAAHRHRYMLDARGKRSISIGAYSVGRRLYPSPHDSLFIYLSAYLAIDVCLIYVVA